MTITNARLEAILQRHPGLRPAYPFDESMGLWWFMGSWWMSEGKSSANMLDDYVAHALIFRAMVEQLPPASALFVPDKRNVDWEVAESIIGDPSKRARDDSAFDAICKFWEAR